MFLFERFSHDTIIALDICNFNIFTIYVCTIFDLRKKYE